MPNETRDRLTIERDRAAVWKLLRKGCSKTHIAQILGVKRRQIDLDYHAVISEIRDKRDKDAESHINRLLQEYGEVKWEAWQAWERSKEEAKKVVTEVSPEKECPVCNGSGKYMERMPCKVCKGTGEVGGSSKETVTVEHRLPEPAYLDKVLECLKAERDLRGLNPAKEVRVKQQTVNWDILAAGVPDGPVPDVIEQEIRKALDYSPGENGASGNGHIPTDGEEGES